MFVQFFLLFFCLFFPFCVTSSEKSHPSPRHDLISFHYMSPVSKTDFRNQGEASLLKTCTCAATSTYVLVDTIGFQGASSSTSAGGNTALFVTSDNIVIDLGGKTVYQNSSTANTNGIEINANQKNITIKNGSIVGFKGAGIYVRPGCDNIRIQNVVISNCGKQGIYCAGSSTSGNDISNCVIENTIVSRTTGVSGIANAVGLQLDYCQNIFINHCLFGQSDASSINKDGIGALIQNGNNVVFQACDASSNKGSDAYGFKITGTDTGSTACSFNQCTAHNNTGINSAGGNGYGFYALTVNATLWQDCIAAGASGTKSGYGFFVSGGNYTNIIHCESNYNKGGTFATTNADGGRGFYATGGAGNAFLLCIASGNQANSANVNAMAIGIDLQSENYPIVNACQARSNGTDAAVGWGVGMQLVNCTQAVIKKSRIFNNRSATASQAFGIRDTASSSTTLITDCFFFGNGQGTTTSNFTVTYPNQGECNVTAPVPVGGVGGIAVVKPFQNITVTSL